MIHIPIGIVALKAAEIVKSTTNNKMLHYSLSKVQSFENIPPEILLHIIDTQYDEHDRFLIACTLCTTNKHFYVIIQPYFNRFFKQVCVYDYLEKQGCLQEPNFNFFDIFNNNRLLNQEPFSVTKEPITLITELPCICIRTTIHFYLNYDKLCHLQFSTQVHYKEDLAANHIKLLSDSLLLNCISSMNPEKLYRSPNCSKLLKKIISLCNNKENALEPPLSFSKDFPKHHRTLYESIQKIIKWNKKGISFGISLFKIYVRNVSLRQDIFETLLFFKWINHFQNDYLKKNSTEKERLCKNKIFFKKYVFKFFKNCHELVYDMLFRSYEKHCFEYFMLPNGFLETNVCKTIAEEVYINELFKQIWSYYLRQWNPPQESSIENCTYPSVSRDTFKMNPLVLNFILQNKIVFKIPYEHNSPDLAIIDIVQKPFNYKMFISQNKLPLPSKNKSIVRRIIKNILSYFIMFVDYTTTNLDRILNYLLK